MAESGLPVDSLAKLLGHEQLQTTQRYINGADPFIRADFAKAMEKLESNLIRDQKPPPLPAKPQPKPQPEAAPETELIKLRERLEELPSWLAEACDDFLSWRWPIWRVKTAYQLGCNLISLVRRFANWLQAECPLVVNWESFQRADLEAWLVARHKVNVSSVTIRSDL